MPAKVEIVGGSWEGAGGMQPGRVRIENLPEVYTELHLTIHEGKFHQVKRMMAAVGNPVMAEREDLILSFGSLSFIGEITTLVKNREEKNL